MLYTNIHTQSVYIWDSCVFICRHQPVWLCVCVCVSLEIRDHKKKKLKKRLANKETTLDFFGRHTLQLAMQGLWWMSRWIHPRKSIILSLGRGLIWACPNKTCTNYLQPSWVFSPGSCICSTTESNTSWTQSTNKTVIQLTLSGWGQKYLPSWPLEKMIFALAFFTFSILKPSYSFKKIALTNTPSLAPSDSLGLKWIKTMPLNHPV